MAKETKEQKPAKAQETTVDNVVEQLRAKNLQSTIGNIETLLANI